MLRIHPILLVAGLLLLAAFLATDQPPRQGLDPNRPEELVRKIDRIVDRNGGGSCRGCVLDLRLWQAEILPWFVEEGIVGATYAPKTVWAFYADGRANHVLGQSDCGDHVWVNARFANPVSAWHTRVDYIATLVHELVHVQQHSACETNEREHVETTAQVVTLEILAAMANNGNKTAGLALLDELKGIVLSELRWQALHDPAKEQQLNSLIREISDPWELAEREQRWRYWQHAPKNERDFVFRAYAHDPYNLLLRALEKGHLDGLALQATYVEAYPPEQRVPRVRFDDLAYFLEHAEEMYGA